MKFAFLIFKVFPYGGVQRDMLRIAHVCAAAGHEVTIFTGEWRGEMPEARIKVQLLPSSGWMNHQKHQSLIHAMQQVLVKNPVDLVVGFNRMAGLDAYYAADPCYVERTHKKGFFYKLTGRYRFFAEAEKAVFGKESQTQILLLTAREKQSFQQFYQTPDERFYLLPPSIPLEKFAGKNRKQCRQYVRAQFNLPENANIILTVGSAFVRKGVDRTIEALAALPKALQDNTWLIAIGEYESKSDMQTYAKDRHIAHRCIQAGGRDDVADLMVGADVLAHPARSELAGIVLIEAMTAGLPVLVTDVCGYAPHIAQANAGVVLTAPYQQESMNAALADMLQSEQKTAWQINGEQYTRHIKNTTSATAEADYLITLANKKLPRPQAGEGWGEGVLNEST
ncbi:MAG TPA: glycosyltransferase family 4 protein [Methylotenera sp.]|nr:glycosyltransferase family 4 protein [Methylotenera sp.]